MPQPIKESPVEKLQRVNRAITEEQRRIWQAQAHSAEQFRASQALRVAMVAGDEATLREEYAKSAASLAEYNRQLALPISADRRAELTELRDQTEATATDIASALGSVAQSQANFGQDVMNVFGQFGIQFNAFGEEFRENLLRNAGAAEEFIASLRPAIDMEKLLAGVSKETAAALRGQMEITARKDETTEAFTERLRTLGFTEEEIAARVDETGRALQRQADATIAATNATAAASSGRVSSDPLANLLGLHEDEFLMSMFGHIPKGMRSMDIAGVVRALRSGESGLGIEGVGAYVGGADGAQREKAPKALQDIILRFTGSGQWDMMLRALNIEGVPAFAHGFDGIVKGPSLFVAGEHGPERVTVGPMARGGGREGSGGGVYIAPGAIVVNGARDPKASANYIMRELRRLGVDG